MRRAAPPAQLANPIVSAFPDTYKTTTRLTQFILATPSGGALTTYTLYANSAYDPLGTIDFIQMIGHNELSNIYTKYRVLNSQIHIEFTNRTSETGFASLYPSMQASILGIN